MPFHLEEYLTAGIESLAKNALRLTLKNPKQSAFFLRFASTAQKAAAQRHTYEAAGEHIPSFLIASITENCNLRCAGCYAMANRSCGENEELTAEEWGRIFGEAEELGVSAILLAGGEPLLRRDVLEIAAGFDKLLFPVFTNATLLDGGYIKFFASHRNLIPIISVEGDAMATDTRRGEGIHAAALAAMEALATAGLLFGVSLTVTAENLDEVTDNAFVARLELGGCKAIVFVEYVPVDSDTAPLDDAGRAKLADRVSALRNRPDSAILISFPGDEAASGGCLAAGRGFFHISASGNAEPCPFSPYSDLSLKNTSLRQTLQSPLFARLKADGILAKPHTGGCVLFEQRELVSGLMVADRRKV